MEQKNEYRAVEGAHLSDAQAQRYGKRLDELIEKNGFVTPEIVVEDAKKATSLLHDYFDWSNREAAEKWRIEQAKTMIRGISITIVSAGKEEVIRSYYSVNPSKDMDTEAKKVYVTMDAVFTDKDKRKEVIGYALMELRGWTERYRQYSELAPMVDYIRRFNERLNKKLGKRGIK